MARVGVIGGTGFESPVTWTEEVRFGPVSLGSFGSAPSVAFVRRHGDDHDLEPRTVKYYENIAALKASGVEVLCATAICGSLDDSVEPGSIVIPDQLVDLTFGNRETYGLTPVRHLPFADPYCDGVRDALLECFPEAIPSGTVCVVPGARFSTRAEADWFARQGWSLINMTQMPEAAIAREHGMCYATIAMVTDYAPRSGSKHDGFASESIAGTLEVFRELKALVDERLSLVTKRLDLLSGEGCRCRLPYPAEYYRDME